MSTSSWHSAENSLHSENDSEFVDVESATSSSSSSSVSSSSESSDRFEAIARVMKLNNYSSLQSMRSVRSRANSVDADVVTTFVESVERVATARRVLESSAAGADVDAPAVPDAKKVKEATKGIENLKKEVEMDEHLISIDELCDRLHTNVRRGLSSNDAAERLARDGPNRLSPARTVPAWVRLGKHLFLGFSGLMWVGAILCFVAFGLEPLSYDNLILAIALLLVVCVTGLFSFIQEGRASKAMQSFSAMVPEFAVVLRDGHATRVNATELVVGDVVELKGGDKVPADLRIVHAVGLKVDNSSLTGESEPLSRVAESTHQNPLESANIAFFTTFAVEGTATGVVINTGDRSVIGRIAQLVSRVKPIKSPISAEIDRFVNIVTIVAAVVGIVFFGIALAIGYPVLTALIYIIGIAVAQIPSGLPTTVTVAMSLAAKRMSRRGVLVKKLTDVATLGSTSVICSDKTGTLTQNLMTVSHCTYAREGTAEIFSNDPGTAGTFDAADQACAALLRVATLCSRATFADDSVVRETPRSALTNATVKDWRTIGDASESALLKWTHVCHDVYQFRAEWPKLFELPFNSTNKYMLSIHECPHDPSRLLLVMKGAPERVMARCQTQLGADGVAELRFDEQARRAVETGAYAELAARGERVLGFAQCWLPRADFPVGFVFDAETGNFPTDRLCFVGLVSLIDPPRDAVPDAVAKCRAAFIRVVMVTGDHPATATAIARQVGIISPQSVTANELIEQRGGNVTLLEMAARREARAIVVHGELLRDMSDDDLDLVLWHDEIVFARTSPQQKLRIVEGFQRRGEVVAVTGDGVNDSPALKKANVGVAMGIAGSDVSKESARLVLMDDNFASIVAAVEEGRLIFANLAKSICYTLTSNLPALAPFMFFIILRIPLGLTTLLILAITLGTDIAPAISLAYEPPEADIMCAPPRRSDERLVNLKLAGLSYLIVGVTQTLSGFFCFFVILMVELGVHPMELLGVEYGNNVRSIGFSGAVPIDMHLGGNFVTRQDRLAALHRAQSGFFLSIVVVQFADLLMCKTRLLSLFQVGVLNNRVVWLGLFIGALVVVLIIYVPFLHTIFNTNDLRGEDWLLPLPLMLVVFWTDEFRKWLIRRLGTQSWIYKHTYY